MLILRGKHKKNDTLSLICWPHTNSEPHKFRTKGPVCLKIGLFGKLSSQNTVAVSRAFSYRNSNLVRISKPIFPTKQTLREYVFPIEENQECSMTTR